jgi:hypothetical protein
MASTVTFRAGSMHDAFASIGKSLRVAVEETMQTLMDTAADDARAIEHWRNPGRYEEDYGGNTWSWEVTGMAAASIQGYVVPNKDLAGQATKVTTSYWNGIALKHPSSTNDAVTGDHQAAPEHIVGVLTMNVAYAPYLQEYELRQGYTPVVVEVFDAQWAQVYVPQILRPGIERFMERVQKRYT